MVQAPPCSALSFTLSSSSGILPSLRTSSTCGPHLSSTTETTGSGAPTRAGGTRLADSYVDLEVTTRECVIGTYDWLIDSGSMACGPAVYNVSKAYSRKIKNYSLKEEG